MGQRQYHAHETADDSAWLTNLVDAFERTERLGNLPCDQKTISDAAMRLRTPAASDGHQTHGEDQHRPQTALEFHH